MQGAPKQQVNAEEMLAELRWVLESSTRAPNAPLRVDGVQVQFPGPGELAIAN
jgi:hypothetical protein